MTFKLADKRAALVELGKHHKLFVERVEHDATIGIADRLEAALKRVGGEEPEKPDAPRKARGKGKRARAGRKRGDPT